MKTSFKGNYELPELFINQIALLEKLIIIPDKVVDVKYVKNYTEPKNNNNFLVKTDKPWTKDKVFKLTVMEVKEGIEKDINDIRKALNMISKTNFETQKEIVLKFVRNFAQDDKSLIKISEFIFDIAYSNKFYGDLYADLYVQFIKESQIFNDVLYNNLSQFKNTIDNIKCVDSSKDYDGYCVYTKEND